MVRAPAARGVDPRRPRALGERPAAAGRALADGDADALLDFQRKAPAGIAHPRTEHFAPLFVPLGASAVPEATTTVEGFWYGLSKRSAQFACPSPSP